LLLTLFAKHSADAEEYLLYIYDRMLEEVKPCKGNLTSHGNPYDNELHSKVAEFWNLFVTGKIEQNISCTRCLNDSQTVTSFFPLDLQFPSQHFHNEPIDMRRAISITDLMEHFCYGEEELISYACRHCTERQHATKTSRICCYPKILCIRIGRTRADNSLIDNPVEFPLTGLQLHHFDISNTPEKVGVFNLIAAVNHELRGNNEGHYTAVSKHQTTNTWYEYDDHRVCRIKFVGKKKNFPKVQYQKTATMLFYEFDQNLSNIYSNINNDDRQNATDDEKRHGKIYVTMDLENSIVAKAVYNPLQRRQSARIQHSKITMKKRLSKRCP